MNTVDPIFVTPRPVQRHWGRVDLGDWTGKRRTPDAPVAEAWLLDPANSTDAGPLGRRITRQSTSVLGDLGRVPPRIRLVFPGKTMTLKSASPMSFWTVLEPGVASLADGMQHRTGERIRAYEGADVTFAEGSVALEVSASFLPTNDADPRPQIIRLPPVSVRARATLFRENGLSVETWLLPEWSRIVPDGETCHVLVPLGAGVRIDGRTLLSGEAVLVPAHGRPLDIVAERQGARLLVAYPDRAPTAVWRHAPGPDPAAGQLPKPEPAQPPVWAFAKPLEPAMAA
jgi:hypothetical protein